MTEEFRIQPIAHIRNDFSSKFGIPRQSGLLDKMESAVVFEPQFRADEALRGIEEYSHLWLIWQFSESLREGFKPTVRPPRLGGNKRVGVFATRSPFRPNSLGLSSVRLAGLRKTKDMGTVLIVTGADLMDGTPIFDIKPYIKYSDCHPDAECSFSDEFKDYALEVELPKPLLDKFPADKQESLILLLKGDPRPSYQHDPERIYTLDFAGYSISFAVDDTRLTVTNIEKLSQ